MKRDMDLVREILRQMEEHNDALGPVPIEVEGRSEEEINYHTYLLDQAGLIEAVSAVSTSSFDYLPLRLTWQGQEFLNAARDDTLWHKAKGKALEVGGGLTFDVLKAMLLAEIKSRLGLGPSA